MPPLGHRGACGDNRKTTTHMSNQLANATSPYLLLHKDNPVDWRVWGPEALAEAAEQNKPILLSIGYTACHWCHVMHHEILRRCRNRRGDE